MRKKSYIARLSSSFILAFVLLTSVLSKQLPQTPHVQTKTKQGTEQKSDPTKSYLSELQIAVVIPASHFQFAQDAIVLPAPQICFLVIQKACSTFVKPVFKHSYFDKLFEHHIAANAP